MIYDTFILPFTLTHAQSMLAPTLCTFTYTCGTNSRLSWNAYTPAHSSWCLLSIPTLIFTHSSLILSPQHSKLEFGLVVCWTSHWLINTFYPLHTLTQERLHYPHWYSRTPSSTIVWWPDWTSDNSRDSQIFSPPVNAKCVRLHCALALVANIGIAHNWSWLLLIILHTL